MDADLGEFLGRLERAGELVRVRAEVSASLEIAEIADRQSKLPCPAMSEHARAFDPDHCEQGGKAILFENVAGSDFPLCINVFGSYRRVEMALNCLDGGVETIAARIAGLVRPQPPRGLRDLLAKAREMAPLLRIPPRRLRRGRCQEVVRLAERGEVDLRRLPLLQCWPLDGDLGAVGWDISAQEAGRVYGAGAEDLGRYVTFAGMHTIHFDDAGDPRPASHNIGVYRAQLLGPAHLAMHWHVHHDGAAHWRSWKQAGKPMPIAICFGGEPVLPYAATAPLPPGMSELLMAGFLNGRGIGMVRARTVPLWVPASSELVLEGWVSTGGQPIGWLPQRRNGALAEPLGPGSAVEGPFGDHTGFYSLPDRYPVVQVTALTHQRDAVFPATIVGPPPQEDYYLGKATERVFLPLLKMMIPDIIDYHLPRFGCFHNCVFISIRKSWALQARRVMHAVWGAGQMAWEKFIVVVDAGVNVHDEKGVFDALVRHCHFRRDLEPVNGPLDILDHAAARLGAGGKLGFDATVKIPGEEVNGVPVAPVSLAMKSAPQRTAEALAGQAGIARAEVAPFGGGRCLFLAVDKRSAGQGPAAIEHAWSVAPSPMADLVIAVDAAVDPRDWEQVFFHLCANTDPGRDLVRHEHRLGIDATRKLPGDEREGQPLRAFPPPIEMSPEVRRKVQSRWGEYGF